MKGVQWVVALLGLAVVPSALCGNEVAPAETESRQSADGASSVSAPSALTDASARRRLVYNPDSGKGYSTGFNHWDVDGIRNRNNCYNFAVNQITNSFARPGAASGIQVTAFSDCGAMSNAVMSDGLIPADEWEVNNGAPNCHYIALVVTPDGFKDQDYHFYRLMKPGYDNVREPLWWHKVGSNPVSKVDFSGKPIRDVKSADRGKYQKFCGYFKVCVRIG